MKTMQKYLKSQKGATLVMALLLMVVVVVVSFIIIQYAMSSVTTTADGNQYTKFGNLSSDAISAGSGSSASGLTLSFSDPTAVATNYDANDVITFSYTYDSMAHGASVKVGLTNNGAVIDNSKYDIALTYSGGGQTDSTVKPSITTDSSKITVTATVTNKSTQAKNVVTGTYMLSVADIVGLEVTCQNAECDYPTPATSDIKVKLDGVDVTDQCTYQFSIDDSAFSSPTGVNGAPELDKVGTEHVTVRVMLSGYKSVVQSYTLKVKYPEKIGLSVAMNNPNEVYGKSASEITFGTVSVTDEAQKDKVNLSSCVIYKLTQNGNPVDYGSNPVPVGEYTVTAVVSDANQYELSTTATGTLTVTPCQVDVSMSNVQKSYGVKVSDVIADLQKKNPTVKRTGTDDVVTDSVEIQYSLYKSGTVLTDSSVLPVGDYDITYAVNSDRSKNYTGSGTAATLTINEIELKAPAKPATLTKEYDGQALSGAASAANNGSITGLGVRYKVSSNGTTYSDWTGTSAPSVTDAGATLYVKAQAYAPNYTNSDWTSYTLEIYNSVGNILNALKAELSAYSAKSSETVYDIDYYTSGKKPYVCGDSKVNYELSKSGEFFYEAPNTFWGGSQMKIADAENSKPGSSSEALSSSSAGTFAAALTSLVTAYDSGSTTTTAQYVSVQSGSITGVMSDYSVKLWIAKSGESSVLYVATKKSDASDYTTSQTTYPLVATDTDEGVTAQTLHYPLQVYIAFRGWEWVTTSNKFSQYAYGMLNSYDQVTVYWPGTKTTTTYTFTIPAG